MNKKVTILFLGSILFGCASTQESTFTAQEMEQDVALFNKNTSSLYYDVEKAFPNIAFDKSFQWHTLEAMPASNFFACEKEALLTGRLSPMDISGNTLFVEQKENGTFINMKVSTDTAFRFRCISNPNVPEETWVQLNNKSKEARLAKEKEAQQQKAEEEKQQALIKQEKVKKSLEWYPLARGGYAVLNNPKNTDNQIYAVLTQDKMGFQHFGLMKGDEGCRWAFDGNVIKVAALSVDGKEKINFEYTCLDIGTGFWEPKGRGFNKLVSKFKKQNTVSIDGLEFSAKGFTSAYNQWRK